jgi:nitroreductase
MYDQTITSQTYVQELLNIPENLNVESIVAIGYPAEEKLPHRKKDLQYEKVYFDVYGNTVKSKEGKRS